ncbi:MAG: zinc dependent phospholipase C family protein [Cyclobacteriaceae bacterium]|nr:zinc dependent phospholipase C family protein [Cyclobacteriaceae bacterium]
MFTLPTGMFGFYKTNLEYVETNAVNPDKRRYLVEAEGQRHYFDYDAYPDSLTAVMPIPWHQVKALFSENFFKENGTLPWHVHAMYYQLRKAFSEKNAAQILRLSSDVGHYLSDANVPLHTTANYNGQLTGQHGIHGFWESRLPELFFEDYNLFTGKAVYLDDPSATVWKHIKLANAAVDSVLLFEKELSSHTSSDEKYSYEKRGNANVRTYSREYSKAYHDMLHGMVERQMRRAIKLTGSFWYTCWVDAGMPNLDNLTEEPVEEPDSLDQRKTIKVFRPHEH